MAVIVLGVLALAQFRANQDLLARLQRIEAQSVAARPAAEAPDQDLLVRLEGQLEQAQGQIKEMQGQLQTVRQVQGRLETMQRQVASAQGGVQSVQAQIKGLEKRLEGLHAGLETVQGQTQVLQAHLRQRKTVGASPLLVRLKDAAGPVTLTTDGRLSLPGRPSLPPEWTRQVKELLTTGTVSQPKAVQVAMAEVRSDFVLRGGGEGETEVPLPVSPVATAVKSTRPTFRWTPAKGAQGYTLVIAERDQIKVVWERDVGTQTWFSLPAEAPELRRGEIYSWQVEANIGGKWEPLWAPVKFRVLDAAALAEVTRLERRFKKSALVLGAVYEAHGLYEEAQKQFEKLKRLNPADPLPKKMLDALRERRSKG